MAKRMNDGGADAALNFWTDADKMTFCSAEPTTYAQGNATYALADAAPTYDAITDGTTSGRKRGIQAKTAVPVDVAGTVNHVALLKTGDSTLRYVTPAPSQAISAGGTLDSGAWAIEVYDPS